MRAILLSLIAVSAPAFAGNPPPPADDDCCALNLWTGEGVSIGNWFFPELNYQVAAGSGTTNPGRLAVGHHDPDRHGITQQALEVSATIRLGSRLSLFGTYSGKVDLNDHWLSEFEEYYAILELPGDARIRGGRFAPRVGYQNELHIHDYTFIDQYLASARMFGEDPLVIHGAEVGLPVLRNLPKGWADRLTVSFGSVPEQEEEEHAHFGPEGEFEGEGNLFAEWAATANYRLAYQATESTRYEFGLSGAWGENVFGRHSQVYGAHFEYLWKPAHADHEGHAGAHDHHHHHASGEFFRWRTEVFARHFGAISGHAEEEAHEEHAEPTVIPAQPEIRGFEREFIGVRPGPNPGQFQRVFRTREVVVQEARPEQVIEAEEEEEEERIRDEFMDMGFYTAMSYGFPSGKLQAHLRAEYVSGVSEAGLAERWRVSPALTWHPTAKLPIHFKLQYNYDHSPSFGDEHSVWAQFSLSWGDCCARH